MRRIALRSARGTGSRSGMSVSGAPDSARSPRLRQRPFSLDAGTDQERGLPRDQPRWPLEPAEVGPFLGSEPGPLERRARGLLGLGVASLSGDLDQPGERPAAVAH